MRARQKGASVCGELRRMTLDSSTVQQPSMREELETDTDYQHTLCILYVAVQQHALRYMGTAVQNPGENIEYITLLWHNASQQYRFRFPSNMLYGTNTGMCPGLTASACMQEGWGPMGRWHETVLPAALQPQKTAPHRHAVGCRHC